MEPDKVLELEFNIDNFYAWPSVKEMVCPVCGHLVQIVVAHLNDYHRWDFLLIACWLESNGGKEYNIEFGGIFV